MAKKTAQQAKKTAQQAKKTAQQANPQAEQATDLGGQADQTQAQSSTTSTKGGGALKIRTGGNLKRFCRAGRVFTDESQVIPLSDLSKKDIDTLKDEQHLRVEEIKA